MLVRTSTRRYNMTLIDMKVKRNFIKTGNNSDSVSFSAGHCAAKRSLPAAAQYPDTFMQRTPSFPPFRTRPPPSCTFRSADVKNKFHECFLLFTIVFFI